MAVTAIPTAQLGLFQLHTPGIIADPTPFYEALHAAEQPVLWDRTVASWLISRHQDVRLLLSHPDATARMDHAATLDRIGDAALEQAFAALDLHVSFVDGDQHRRLRRPLAEPLQIRQVRTTLAPSIRAAVTDAFAALDDDHVIDAVPAIAANVPPRVVQSLLDLDVDLDTVRRWSQAWGEVVAAPGHVPTTDRAAVLAQAGELLGYLRGLVARHEATTRSSDDTLIGGLVHVVREGGMTRDELLANLMLLLTAGTETTANLLAATLMVLADEPPVWTAVTHRPDAISDIVEEIGRLYPPTQYTARKLTAPITLPSGPTLRAGASVVLLLAAANRDPQEFPDPERFLLDRDAARPVTFGHGAHFCFGAPLAREEARLVVEHLTAGYARPVAAPGRAWRRNGNLRGLARLPLTLHRTARAGER